MKHSPKCLQARSLPARVNERNRAPSRHFWRPPVLVVSVATRGAMTLPLGNPHCARREVVSSRPQKAQLAFCELGKSAGRGVHRTKLGGEIWLHDHSQPRPRTMVATQHVRLAGDDDRFGFGDPIK